MVSRDEIWNANLRILSCARDKYKTAGDQMRESETYYSLVKFLLSDTWWMLLDDKHKLLYFDTIYYINKNLNSSQFLKNNYSIKLRKLLIKEYISNYDNNITHSIQMFRVFEALRPIFWKWIDGKNVLTHLPKDLADIALDYVI